MPPVIPQWCHVPEHLFDSLGVNDTRHRVMTSD
jgi:hypothetical protein